MAKFLLPGLSWEADRSQLSYSNIGSVDLTIKFEDGYSVFTYDNFGGVVLRGQIMEVMVDEFTMGFTFQTRIKQIDWGTDKTSYVLTYEFNEENDFIRGGAVLGGDAFPEFGTPELDEMFDSITYDGRIKDDPLFAFQEDTAIYISDAPGVVEIPFKRVIREGDDTTQTIRGGDGRDIIYGNGGNDRILGRNSNDYLNGGDGNDSLYGGEGNNVLVGERGRDRLESGDGDDLLIGGKGNDTLNSGNGNDKMNGANGKDVLISGFFGSSLMIGGDGDDRFVFQSGGSHKIRDFRPGEDVIDLSSRFIDNVRNLKNLEDNFLTETRKNVIIEIDLLQVKLINTQIDDLSESDFIF